MNFSDMKQFEQIYREQVRFDSFLGMELNVEEPGKVTYTLEVREDHLTAPDSAHGGVAAAMMDATLGVAALSYAVSHGYFCATVEFKINYLAQVRPGYILVGTGRIKHTGVRLIVTQADIIDKKSGHLVATGQGTFTQYPMEKRPNLMTVEE